MFVSLSIDVSPEITGVVVEITLDVYNVTVICELLESCELRSSLCINGVIIGISSGFILFICLVLSVLQRSKLFGVPRRAVAGPGRFHGNNFVKAVDEYTGKVYATSPPLRL